MAAIIIYLLWWPISAMLSGALLAKYYDWFISGEGAAFHAQAVAGSIPMDISIIQALGVSLIVTYMLSGVIMAISSNGNKDGDDTIADTVGKAIIGSILTFLLFWIVGAIYHSFI